MRQSAFRYRQVEQQLLKMIEGGTLRPGEKLPSLRKLSGRLGVSIATVSQAYLELEKKGFISARERSGYFLKATAAPLPRPASRPRPALVPTLGARSGLIQQVLEALGNRDLLPFGVVCPAEELLPSRTLARMFAAVQRERPGRTLDYAPVAGTPELRRQIALRALDSGLSVTPEEILITGGAMEGLAIALRVLTRPGDNVLIQSPSYFCLLQLLENCGLRAVEVPSATSGVDVTDIEHAVERYDIRAAILTPNFNNPDGSLTGREQKRRIVELLAARRIPLVEDDVYGELYFDNAAPGTCKESDPGGEVIYCSSFSKTISPGYRVGWMLPGRYFERVLDLKTTTNICTATPNQLAIAAFLQQGYFDRHLRRLRHAIRDQMEHLLLAINRHYPPDTRAGFPAGGASLWVELPQSLKAVNYFKRARREGIGLAPGPIFTTQDQYDNFIRLSCTGRWDAQMAAGIARLGELAQEMVRE